MIPLPELRSVLARVMRELRDGAEALQAGDPSLALLHFSLAESTLRRLDRLLDGTRPPMRRFAVVGGADKLEPWMERKHGDDPDAA